MITPLAELIAEQTAAREQQQDLRRLAATLLRLRRAEPDPAVVAALRDELLDVLGRLRAIEQLLTSTHDRDERTP